MDFWFEFVFVFLLYFDFWNWVGRTPGLSAPLVLTTAWQVRLGSPKPNPDPDQPLLSPGECQHGKRFAASFAAANAFHQNVVICFYGHTGRKRGREREPTLSVKFVSQRAISLQMDFAPLPLVRCWGLRCAAGACGMSKRWQRQRQRPRPHPHPHSQPWHSISDSSGVVAARVKQFDTWPHVPPAAAAVPASSPALSFRLLGCCDKRNFDNCCEMSKTRLRQQELGCSSDTLTFRYLDMPPAKRDSRTAQQNESEAGKAASTTDAAYDCTAQPQPQPQSLNRWFC